LHLITLNTLLVLAVIANQQRVNHVALDIAAAQIAGNLVVLVLSKPENLTHSGWDSRYAFSILL